MDYKFLDSSIDTQSLILPNSDKINSILLKNNNSEIIKAIDFISSDEKVLYVHGFLGTGKRQFINYSSNFLDKDVVRLEYYCKASTVSDDILLSFIDFIEKNILSQTVSINAKISALIIKFKQYLTSIKRPFLITLHSLDDILDENKKFVLDVLEQIISCENVKVIISTRALNPDILGELKFDRKIFLKGLTKDNFKEYLSNNKITCSDTTLEDFYKYTRGYYYYTALSIKIIQAMKFSLNEFLEKYTLSGMSFDSFLGVSYVNLVPSTIRNFFWFLRTIRHGISIEALETYELYDEFSVEYLKNNLMIFLSENVIYVQDYFQQNIDISIPPKTEIKLHKYIIGIYEKQLKEPLQTRVIMLSRQAMRAEIEYHNQCINGVDNKTEEQKNVLNPDLEKIEQKEEKNVPDSVEVLLKEAKRQAEENKNTEAIEIYLKILDSENIDFHTILEARLELARLYKIIKDYSKSRHYYELIETYYKLNDEVINLNYLYYELTDLYFWMYKNERAIDTIKKVIYSVDTPQSLMVDACTLLGNIYSSTNNPDEAYMYYQKAIDSLDENTSQETLAELYFKFALSNDDKGDSNCAFEYYSKCISVNTNTSYKALAYSNMGSCYKDNGNFSDASVCYKKAYDIEKANNNYDGIYYTASELAQILIRERNPKALDYLIEAQQSAEFIYELYYIMESTVALGDYYYNNISLNKKALNEYFKALSIAKKLQNSEDISKIEDRILDMKLRMDKDVFDEIERKYE